MRSQRRTSNKSLAAELSGGDLRSLGKVASVISRINNQQRFDQLFGNLFSADRIVRMRAADAIEKISSKHPRFLANHKKAIFSLCDTSADKELVWHLAQLLPRLHLLQQEKNKAERILTLWAEDDSQSKIVRVNALQSLWCLLHKQPEGEKRLKLLFSKLIAENVPSINARIRLLNKNRQTNN